MLALTPNIYQYSNLRFRLKSEIWAFGDVTTDKSQIVIISRCSEICFKISDLSSNLRFKHWFSLVIIGCCKLKLMHGSASISDAIFWTQYSSSASSSIHPEKSMRSGKQQTE